VLHITTARVRDHPLLSPEETVWTCSYMGEFKKIYIPKKHVALSKPGVEHKLSVSKLA
jgi:hypothetical protein